MDSLSRGAPRPHARNGAGALIDILAAQLGQAAQQQGGQLACSPSWRRASTAEGSMRSRHLQLLRRQARTGTLYERKAEEGAVEPAAAAGEPAPAFVAGCCGRKRAVDAPAQPVGRAKQRLMRRMRLTRRPRCHPCFYSRGSAAQQGDAGASGLPLGRGTPLDGCLRRSGPCLGCHGLLRCGTEVASSAEAVAQSAAALCRLPSAQAWDIVAVPRWLPALCQLCWTSRRCGWCAGSAAAGGAGTLNGGGELPHSTSCYCKKSIFTDAEAG